MFARIPRWMVVFWLVVFASTLANTKVGALITHDTFLAFLLSLGTLLLAGALVPVGIGVSLWRRSWRPLWTSGFNLLVSVAVFYSTLVLVLNVNVLDLVRGRPLVVASYEGTQNWATLTLRPEGRMDLLSRGWPGILRFDAGTYELHDSDLLLRFDERGGPEPLPYGFEHIDHVVIIGDEICRPATEGGYHPRFRIVHEEPGGLAR